MKIDRKYKYPVFYYFKHNTFNKEIDNASCAINSDTILYVSDTFILTNIREDSNIYVYSDNPALDLAEVKNIIDFLKIK